MSKCQIIIIGGGITGLATALHLARNGFPSLIVEKEERLGGLALMIHDYRELVLHMIEQVTAEPLIRCLLPAQLVHLSGVRGEFEVFIELNDATLVEPASEIVFAAGLDPINEPLTTPCPVPMLTLLDLERLRCEPADVLLPTKGRALMVLARDSGSDNFAMHVALKTAIFLKESQGLDVLVVTDMVRFHEAWTSEFYQRCRLAGVRFLKSAAPPELLSEHGACRFRIKSPVLASGNREAYLQGDFALLIVEPRYSPQSFHHLFYSPQQMDQDARGYNQQPNLQYAPVFSERAGIFLVGAVNGLRSIERCLQEAAIAAGAIAATPVPHPYAVVDDTKCAICLTCVRTCPHHAISLGSTAKISEDACFGCGNCIPECPAQAISFHGSLWESPPVNPGELVVYGCEGSTAALLALIAADEPIIRTPLKIKTKPCSGSIAVLDIIDDLKAGARGVFVAACHEGNCQHLSGNHRAAQRVNQVRELLHELGLNPTRVQMATFAATMKSHLIRAIQNFEQSLELE